MVLDGPRPITHVATALGIHATTLGNWVSQFRASRRPGPRPDHDGPGNDRERQLERENQKLREENAFLKKAASFFARDHR